MATVALAIQIGGPGSLIWIWATALLGMILKYSEIYLGMKYRVPNSSNSYNGGPMYFLPKAFPGQGWIVALMAFSLCLYGIEVYMFNVIQVSVAYNWGLDPNWVAAVLIIGILIIVAGGVERLGGINAILLPIFVVIFLGMTIYVLFLNYEQIPSMVAMIVKSAFTGHAAVGGFAGSALMLTMAKGFSSASYSGDVGIGYASLIHSESSSTNPSLQASLSIFGIFLDTIVVCTCVVLLLVVTGIWQENIDSSMLVQAALSKYFPYMHIFMPIFMLILGFTTITAYMVAGLKCAEFLLPKFGRKIYYVYGVTMFILFSQVRSEQAMTIMSISGGLLMLINLPGIYRLRKEIKFDI